MWESIHNRSSPITLPDEKNWCPKATPASYTQHQLHLHSMRSEIWNLLNKSGGIFEIFAVEEIGINTFLAPASRQI